ncbi:MAG: FAD-dependent oxidoreductase [Acidimicrobiales bacterium]
MSEQRSDRQHLVVVGGGIAGMLAALLLARDGHAVTVVERDDTDLPDTADAAFDGWDRRGAPHARQSHALLARLRRILRERLPDVYDALLDQGATELSVDRIMPPGITDREPRPGDDDLALLCCRRLTIEWVLRRAVTAEPGVTWRSGVGVANLLAVDGEVAGVRLEDDSEITGDLTVVAGGRNSPVLDWIEALGGDVAPTEEHSDAGIVYLSRFYRLRPGRELPVLTKTGAGGDLGYLAFAGFYGDNETFSITFGVPTGDKDLRALRKPDAWEAAIRQMTPLEPWTADGLADPISEVETMARLENRLRRFVVDGEPVAPGLVVIGDAAMATNPWYGKGCSAAGVAAEALTAALGDHGGDRRAVVVAVDEAMRSLLEPHYQLSCKQDADRIKLHTALHDGSEPDPVAAATRDFVLNGLIPATRTDPDVYRAFFRSFNMLDDPAALFADQTVMAAAGAAHAAKDERPPEPALGPERGRLLEVMGVG